MFNLMESTIIIFALQHYIEWIKEGPVSDEWIDERDEYISEIRAVLEKVIKGGN